MKELESLKDKFGIEKLDYCFRDEAVMVFNNEVYTAKTHSAIIKIYLKNFSLKTKHAYVHRIGHNYFIDVNKILLTISINDAKKCIEAFDKDAVVYEYYYNRGIVKA